MKYQTLEAEATSFHEVKGSKFYGYAVPFETEVAAFDYLADLGAQHPKASHCCYGLTVGLNQLKVKSSDDGEPSRTAAGPILQHIEGAGFHNILVAVVRYFGGVKLGKGGLISAYGAAAKQLLLNGTPIQKQEMTQVTVSVAYSNYPSLCHALKQHDIAIYSEEYAATLCYLYLTIPSDETAYWREWLNNQAIEALQL